MLTKIDNHDRPATATRPRVIVVGAGMGGLAAAIRLAASGFAVTVVERRQQPGGKLREVPVMGRGIDSGPTVFTMRWVFDALFAAAGERLEDHIGLSRAGILARHSWEDGAVFDLHADMNMTADAVFQLAGKNDAQGYRAFCARTAEVFRTLNRSFMENPDPSPTGLARSAGVAGLAALARIEPFTSLWKVVGRYFRDPRLRQLFGRYATYCGSSPYDAPGPLMLIAHVEQMGVWLVDGGMMRLAEALERLATNLGVVTAIQMRGGRASGIGLASGEHLEADAVVFNGDPAALFSGLLGEQARGAVPSWPAGDRSLSALTWSIDGAAYGFPLSRHTVFFSSDYRREFDDIRAGRLPGDPTIYICAQDRDDSGAVSRHGAERLFLLVNAPANADAKHFSQGEIASCEKHVMDRLARAGLVISAPPEARVVTTPSDFARMFPATGGALYGRSSHGWAASFQRPGARTRIKGLYLAGGGVHPGPGIPMAVLSGSHAASAVTADLASTAMSRRVATPGGTRTRSATMAPTR
jgi:1-hydroxycarotenoid 3,4-desaturase